MTSVRLETSLQIAYLLPHADSFWRWSNDGESVVWRKDGRTIAFRKEIWAVLQRLAPHAVPPFGALVLLLDYLGEIGGNFDVIIGMPDHQ